MLVVTRCGEGLIARYALIADLVCRFLGKNALIIEKQRDYH